MAQIVPTVLAITPNEYHELLNRAESLSERVHVDICENKFANHQTINIAQVYGPKHSDLDLHIMVQEPVTIFETAVALHPNLMIYHFESTGDLVELIKRTQALGIKAGLGLLQQTPVAAAAELIKQVDHVLVFTGHLGFNGGKFDHSQLPKVNEVRKINPRVEISVDGGVVLDAVPDIVQSHVDVIDVGSAIQKASDPKLAFSELQTAAGVLL